MRQVTVSNYIPKYLLNPLCKEISKLDQAICLVASVVLGFLTIGLLHLGTALYQWRLRRVENRALTQGLNSDLVKDPAVVTLTDWGKEFMRLVRRGGQDCSSELCGQLDEHLKKDDRQETEEYWVHGTALHTLAKYGQPIEFVPILAENKFDFNFTDGSGNTPLLWAIANGNNKIALEILEYKQNLDIQDTGSRKNSALHLATAKGYKNITAQGKNLTVPNLALIEKMAENGANPNLKNGFGYTALHLACIRRDPDMIRALLDAKGDLSVMAPENRGCLALLDMTWEEAGAVMNKVAVWFLLPKSDFDANKKKCVALISGKE